MNARRVQAAEGVILAALKTRKTAAGVAIALESACLLQSPESAAELARMRAAEAEMAKVIAATGLALYEEEQETARLRLAWKSARERARAYGEGILRHVADRDTWMGWAKAAEAEVVRLRAERHSTNEELSKAVEQLRVQRDRIAELEAEVRRLNTLHGDAAQLIERERGHGEECVDIADLEAALMLGGPSEGELAEQRHLVDPLDHALEALAPRTTPTAGSAL
ncbi:hypothetical protein ACF09L_19020 [Streptomyces sp. NPDC014779]|uniref:hypothetical protein n=1 Tax=Streptomyces sp. NPDC014779 TaxID=3364911 RepID=UPI0036FAED96